MSDSAVPHAELPPPSNPADEEVDAPVPGEFLAGEESESSLSDSTEVELPPPPTHAQAELVKKRDREGPPSHRDDIVIPDYTLLKRIGSGAYGEVWLAQSVTGALRAVKIVWREDFELTRTFHREFQGIQQFEPISRGHPCLVHILHVGWNEKRGFYYCVMELADDAEDGATIHDVKSYVPRTLTTDMKRHGRLDPFFCRDAGVYMADALHYMHNHGLTHRDIKPSNIIFVGGVCKLADIGLVAAFGERTFVGTEGFVPPEGPGTPQADIYSLGKVLYEMSSGKDRMEFPEVPDNLSDEEWPFWIDLNRVICQACESDLERRFANASDFAEALQHVGDKKPETFVRRFSRAAILTTMASFLVASSIVMARHQREWAYAIPLPERPKPVLPVRPQPPTPGKPWQNRLKQWFTYKQDRHVADQPLDPGLFRSFLGDERPAEYGVVKFILPDKSTLLGAAITKEDADAFCAWMTEMDRRSGRLDADHEYVWQPVSLPRSPDSSPPRKGHSAIRCEIVAVKYGSLNIASTPSGADIFDGDQLIGRTPISLKKVRADTFNYEVRLPGYKPEAASGRLKEQQSISFNLRLKATGAVVFGKAWQNSLGIKFVPLGKAMLASIETRRKDFAEFAMATNQPPVDGRILDSAVDLPVTMVNRSEAEQFCRWLTDRERGRGLLEPDQEYRLPTDDEWSMAAYLSREVGKTPAERSLRIDGIYPWGFIWPPPTKSGNFFDKSADKTGKKSIPGYNDGAAGPTVAGTFRADGRGLFDLSGNVWEWVSDSWKDMPDQGVLRGGAYTTAERQELLASYRRQSNSADRHPDAGFRLLLWNIGQMARADED
ncbi:bifunctional serine/threonine-protein kinase/formylglycine-generating enzyme family protein [Prosthecobacter sp.]|uniref:bifunctional serine/threonine-protein kinase/formylglycine-generating enzyme family protein n=1 Tax=Prosthecobacter sp. TaxID=1965333 RepID=UPI001DF79DD5|nr:bifunctional serine/threonine-protein kinase/formylglycine-generating enzyme family protein [Prosthecobacter sp.]MCB1277260.1 SUMF1/EgtB/PvdO family nonheme iron enzyme [Prosthecobacter sp.]